MLTYSFLDSVNQETSNGLSKYVIDEMYIKEGLLYNKNPGTLVGFEDPGDINTNLLTML